MDREQVNVLVGKLAGSADNPNELDLLVKDMNDTGAGYVWVVRGVLGNPTELYRLPSEDVSHCTYIGVKGVTTESYYHYFRGRWGDSPSSPARIEDKDVIKVLRGQCPITILTDKLLAM